MDKLEKSKEELAQQLKRELEKEKGGMKAYLVGLEKEREEVKNNAKKEIEREREECEKRLLTLEVAAKKGTCE